MSQISNTTVPAPQIKSAQLHTFHTRLAKWYRAHGRHDLPWRSTADPYRIWLSEVMLQQTQVQTVLTRFYHPFLAKFPTVEALAKAPQQDVMKAWEGLGYYSRARNLHEAAKIAVASGMWQVTTSTPSPATCHPSPGTLLSLPGIGRNTAHAILAFAYHQPVAILEANVKRVVARVFAWKKPSDKQLWAGAEALLNKAKPFDYNQAMMDVGSSVCTPKSPHCTACPLNNLCQGKANPTAYPTPRPKKITQFREVVIEVRVDARGYYYLEKRAENLLGGLYGFPQAAAKNAPSGEWLGEIRHAYSHFTLIAQIYVTHLATRGQSPNWHSAAALAALPLSMVDRKIIALVEKRHSGQKKLINVHGRKKRG